MRKDYEFFLLSKNKKLLLNSESVSEDDESDMECKSSEEKTFDINKSDFTKKEELELNEQLSSSSDELDTFLNKNDSRFKKATKKKKFSGKSMNENIREKQTSSKIAACRTKNSKSVEFDSEDDVIMIEEKRIPNKNCIKTKPKKGKNSLDAFEIAYNEIISRSNDCIYEEHTTDHTTESSTGASKIMVNVFFKGETSRYIVDINSTVIDALNSQIKEKYHLDDSDYWNLKFYKNDLPLDVNKTILQNEIAFLDNLDCMIIQNNNNEAEDPESLKVKFQDGSKHPPTMRMKKTEKFARVFFDYCSIMQMKIENFKFSFDGDIVLSHQTPVDIDMDEDLCIDVQKIE